MAKTLLLDRTAWDVVLDSSGNIALAAEPYAQVQDVASAVRVFLGDLWYDRSQGLPYFQLILGKRPPLSLVKAAVVNAAFTVPGVIAARCLIATFKSRTITGQVQVKLSAGVVDSLLSSGPRSSVTSFNGSPLVTFDGYYIVSF